MNPVFQFIAASIIVILVMGFTVYEVTTASILQLNQPSSQQLQPLADRLMDNFILSSGYPSDWGNPTVNLSMIHDFGLALVSSSISSYTLDVYKINRIINGSFVNNNLYIPPSITGALLGIYQQGHFNYGFEFRLVPALKITIANITNSKFNISVTNINNLPASNALVNASFFTFCVITKQTGNSLSVSNYNVNVSKAFNETNLHGWTIISLQPPSQNCSSKGNSITTASILFVAADYYGLRYQTFLSTPSICTAQMIIQGQYLVANFTSKSNPNCQIGQSNNGALFTQTEVFEVTQSLNTNVVSATTCSNSAPPCSLLNNGNNNYKVFNLSYAPSQDVIFAGVLVTKNQGNNNKVYMVVASNPITPSGVIEYSADSLTTSQYLASQSRGLIFANVTAATTDTRLVNLGGNTWIAYLSVWEMGQS